MAVSDGSNKRCVPLFAGIREYARIHKRHESWRCISQIIVNSMIPLFDNDVFKLNGKYDHDLSGSGIMQVDMMMNPVNAKGKRFICRHQNAVRFMLNLLAGKQSLKSIKAIRCFLHC